MLVQESIEDRIDRVLYLQKADIWRAGPKRAMIIFVFFSGSQDLNRPLPPSYNKFSSLDRRALTRRHQPNQTVQNQPNQTVQNQPNQSSAGTPNQIKLSTFNPQEHKELNHFNKFTMFIHIKNGRHFRYFLWDFKMV